MWKTTHYEEEGNWDDDNDQWISTETCTSSPSSHVKQAPHLHDDLHSLQYLMNAPTPPLWAVSSSIITVCLYGFVGASGAGFGNSIALPDGTILYRQGLWGCDADSTSSNFRE
jgi:hypothetical protein